MCSITPAYKVESLSALMCPSKPTNSFNKKSGKLHELKIFGLKLVLLVNQSLVIVDLMGS